MVLENWLCFVFLLDVKPNRPTKVCVAIIFNANKTFMWDVSHMKGFNYKVQPSTIDPTIS